MADLKSEYEALKNTVGILDYSPFSRIRVGGADRIVVLHSILTNNIKSLPPGQSCYAMLLTAQGKILADMWVIVLADQILLISEPGTEEKLLNLLGRHIITEDVELQGISGRYAHFSLQGPNASRLFQELSLNQRDGFYFERRLRSLSWFDLIIPRENSETVKKMILEKGKLFGIKAVSYEASELARIEADIPRFGIDFNEETVLNETGLEDVAASETKGCYPGQEVVARIKTYGGLKRKIVKRTFDCKQAVSPGQKLFSGEEVAGVVTSAAHFPWLGQYQALVLLDSKFLDSNLLCYPKNP